MPELTVGEIELRLSKLWMNRGHRKRLLEHSPGTADLQLPLRFLEQIDRAGIKLYARLLNTGHQELMTSVYPGCAKLIGRRWRDVVDDYLEKFPPDHFYLNRAAARFADYLTQYGKNHLRKYPFLAELADYEWLELELLEHPACAKAAPCIALSSPEQFQYQRPLVNPVLAIRRYRHPITKIVEILQQPANLPGTIAPEPVSIVVLRDPQSHECRFLELGEIAAKIVEAAWQNNCSYKDLLCLFLSNFAATEQNIIDFLNMVEKLQDVKVFIGSVCRAA